MEEKDKLKLLCWKEEKKTWEKTREDEKRRRKDKLKRKQKRKWNIGVEKIWVKEKAKRIWRKGEF